MWRCQDNTVTCHSNSHTSHTTPHITRTCNIAISRQRKAAGSRALRDGRTGVDDWGGGVGEVYGAYVCAGDGVEQLNAVAVAVQAQACEVGVSAA